MRLSGILRGTGLVLLCADVAMAVQIDRLPLTRSGYVPPATASQSQTSASDITRAEQLVRDGKYQEAYDLLNPSAQSLSGDYKFNYLLGRAALGIGQADKAKELFERSIELNGNWVAPHLGLGRAYFARGQYSQAKFEFETVLQIGRAHV